MKKSEALPGKYLAKGDFDKPTLVKINRVELEGVKNDRGEFEDKPVLYVDSPSNPQLDCTRGIILNVGNWEACEEIDGADDSDAWVGTEIVIWTDESVMFGAKKVGGIRIRKPSRTNKPAPVEEPMPMPDGDIPF